MTYRSTLFTLPVAALAVSGGLMAAEVAVPDVDPCVVYPYYGQTSTPVPGATGAVGGSGDTAASRAVVTEWGVTETPEDLERVLAALRHGQYLGL